MLLKLTVVFFKCKMSTSEENLQSWLAYDDENKFNGLHTTWCCILVFIIMAQIYYSSEEFRGKNKPKTDQIEQYNRWIIIINTFFASMLYPFYSILKIPNLHNYYVLNDIKSGHDINANDYASSVQFIYFT